MHAMNGQFVGWPTTETVWEGEETRVIYHSLQYFILYFISLFFCVWKCNMESHIAVQFCDLLLLLCHLAAQLSAQAQASRTHLQQVILTTLSHILPHLTARKPH